MTRTTNRRTKYDARKGTTRHKGDILEQIVASMHKSHNIKVETNVFLPPLDREGNPREIDVLLSAQTDIYPIRFAVECKNLKGKVGISEIGEFIDKLDDVGIPSQCGIFVAVNGYESGALQRAKKRGIKAMILRDVSAELPNTIDAAIQTSVHLLLVITKMTVKNDVGEKAPFTDILFFKDNSGNACGSVPDLVWRKWRRNEIPIELGSHEIQLQLPREWNQIVNGQKAIVSEITVDYIVDAYVCNIPGEVDSYSLFDANSDDELKRYSNVDFSKTNGKYKLICISSKSDLEGYIESIKSRYKLVFDSIKLPRIRWGGLYWPPSLKAMEKFYNSALERIKNGRLWSYEEFQLENFEEDDLSAIWDTVVSDYPLMEFVHNQNKNKPISDIS